MVVATVVVPPAVVIVLPKRLETGAQIAAKHLASGEKLIDGAVDRGARYRKYAPPRSEHRHADHPSLRVNDGSSFGPWAELDIKTDEAVDLPSPPAVPSPIRIPDNTEVSERCSFVIPDGEHKVPGVWRRIGARRRSKPVRLEAKHCNIGSRVTPGERGLDDAPARKRKLDRFLTLHGFFSGNDDAGAPVDSARRSVSTTVNGNDAARRAFNELGNIIGQCAQMSIGFSHDKTSRTVAAGSDMSLPRRCGY
jgi:hypothetical protein